MDDGFHGICNEATIDRLMDEGRYPNRMEAFRAIVMGEITPDHVPAAPCDRCCSHCGCSC